MDRWVLKATQQAFSHYLLLFGNSSCLPSVTPLTLLTALFQEACHSTVYHCNSCWWGLGSLYFALVYCHHLHDPFIFINIKMTSTFYTETCYISFPLYILLTSLHGLSSVVGENIEALIFLKLSSDVEWFSSPHTPSMQWTLRMSLFWAWQGWTTQTHWWIWMRPYSPSCLHSSSNDGQSWLKCIPHGRPSI